MARMEYSEFSEDELERTTEERKHLRCREAFVEKNAKKYGSKAEARAVFDHWA